MARGVITCVGGMPPSPVSKEPSANGGEST